MKRIRNKSRKTLLLSVLTLVVVLLGVYASGVYQIVHFNKGMVVPETDSNLLAQITLNERGTFVSPSGKEVILDMGSRHSFLTQATLDELKREGYPAKEYPTLIFTTDHSGHYRLFTRKVVMPILLPGVDGKVLRLDNAEMLIADPTTGNIIGMDCLERFVVERSVDTGVISLYRTMPEGYRPVARLAGHDSKLGDILGYSRRVYLPLVVNDQPVENYYLDTGRGMLNHTLVQPYRNKEMATTKVFLDSISGLYKQREGRVMVGNRMKFTSVTYCDTLHTDDYSVNPFRMFNKNSIAMDLPNRMFYMQDSGAGVDSLQSSE